MSKNETDKAYRKVIIQIPSYQDLKRRNLAYFYFILAVAVPAVLIFGFPSRHLSNWQFKADIMTSYFNIMQGWLGYTLIAIGLLGLMLSFRCKDSRLASYAGLQLASTLILIALIHVGWLNWFKDASY